jgi:hypothetical protein
MSERKTEVINLRMSPRVKVLLRHAAAHERRTLSNMLEVLIIEFCREHQIDEFDFSSGPDKPHFSEATSQLDAV